MPRCGMITPLCNYDKWSSIRTSKLRLLLTVSLDAAGRRVVGLAYAAERLYSDESDLR